MRTAQTRTATLERRNAIDAIEASMEQLFRRCPGLTGFSVLEEGAERELCIAHIALQPGYGETQGPRDEIVAALFELLDEHAAAHELLRGRTFARRLH